MVAFHSQQAVEKSLKAIVEEFEIGFVKIHNLERLLGMVRKQISLDVDLDIIKRLDEVYISTRYPGDLGLSHTEAQSIQRLTVKFGHRWTQIFRMLLSIKN
jgi:HEPN domain-containing protein